MRVHSGGDYAAIRNITQNVLYIKIVHSCGCKHLLTSDTAQSETKEEVDKFLDFTLNR